MINFVYKKSFLCFLMLFLLEYFSGLFNKFADTVIVVEKKLIWDIVNLIREGGVKKRKI